jgi:hypothetical protein
MKDRKESNRPKETGREKDEGKGEIKSNEGDEEI